MIDVYWAVLLPTVFASLGLLALLLLYSLWVVFGGIPGLSTKALKSLPLVTIPKSMPWHQSKCQFGASSPSSISIQPTLFQPYLTQTKFYHPEVMSPSSAPSYLRNSAGSLQNPSMWMQHKTCGCSSAATMCMRLPTGKTSTWHSMGNVYKLMHPYQEGLGHLRECIITRVGQVLHALGFIARHLTLQCVAIRPKGNRGLSPTGVDSPIPNPGAKKRHFFLIPELRE
jgi:hypothetical protein